MATTDWFGAFDGELLTEPTPIHDQVLADLAAAAEVEGVDADVPVDEVSS